LFTCKPDATAPRSIERKCRQMQETLALQGLPRDRYIFSKNRTIKILLDQFAKLDRFFSAVYPLLLQIE
jgi:hypothetical protein